MSSKKGVFFEAKRTGPHPGTRPRESHTEKAAQASIRLANNACCLPPTPLELNFKF